jgi:NurA-like 5'-3' nuclease
MDRDGISRRQMLINKTNQTIAILAITNVSTYICAITLLRKLAREKRRYKNLSSFTTYLLAKLEENEIEFTAFDLIALQVINEEKYGPTG